VSRSIRRHLLPIEDHELGEDFILHLQGPVLSVSAMGENIQVHTLHDDTILSKTFILRIFANGQNIPYHFTYVGTVPMPLGMAYHVCQYTEDDEAWTPASMNGEDAQSVTSLAPSLS
jgi:hypothetical protein